MTTKSKIAEQAQRILAGGDVPDGFNVLTQELILIVPQARDYLAELNYLKNKASGYSDIDTGFLTTYKNVAVLLDEDLNLKYSVLPAPYITMPNNLGLYHVGPMQDQSSKFKLVSASNLAIYTGLEVQQNQHYIGYWRESYNGEQRVYYNDPLNGPKYACTEVLIKLILDVSEIDDDEEFYIPSGMQLQLIQAVAQIYSGEIKPKDRIVDNLTTNSMGGGQ